MRARSLEAGRFEGASHSVEAGLVGIGEPLDRVPGSVAEAVLSTRERHGEKAARMLDRFARLEQGSLCWAQTGPSRFRLGRIIGPWRYDDSPEARRTGIHQVRAADWLERVFDPETTPEGVAGSFARGGRNFQRINDGAAEIETERLLERHAPG